MFIACISIVIICTIGIKILHPYVTQLLASELDVLSKEVRISDAKFVLIGKDKE